MSAPAVHALDRDSLNLLGLMVESLLQERLSGSRLGPLLAFSGKSLALKTAGMSVTLRFSREAITVENGFDEHAASRLTVDMGLLMDLVTGRLTVRDLDPFRFKIAGSPLPALALFAVIQLS